VEQEGDANRELWIWFRFCVRDGGHPLLIYPCEVEVSLGYDRGVALRDEEGVSVAFFGYGGGGAVAGVDDGGVGELQKLTA
jgi:hypothetical protein